MKPGRCFFMLKSVCRKRSKVVGIIFSLLFLVLFGRLYIVIYQYSPEKVSVSMGNYQLENISESDFTMTDSKGKDIKKYIKKYIVVIDSKPFSLNNYNENMRDILAFNFIMKSQVDDFKFDEVLRKTGKNYFAINKESYDKIKCLKDIKGVYAYEYDELNNKNSWAITDMLSKINGNSDYEDSSLESEIQGYIKSNKPSQIKFVLDKSGLYSENGILINKENKNIALTLDLDLDDRIKDILNKSEYSEFKNAGVILMESESGNIKALVQKNDTLPNMLIGAEGIGYEPASTFKLIVEQAALENKTISLNDRFICKGEICEKNGKPYAHGELTVREALLVSCNDVFYQVAQKTGYDNIMNIAQAEGLYSKSLGLSKEISGMKPKEDAGLSNIAIGQSMTVTPVQMAGAINTIVNGGIYVKPNIIQAVSDINNNNVKNFSPSKVRVISKGTASQIKENMRSVVLKGTGMNANLSNIEIGGKTGSATGAQGTTHGWFSGYFKLQNKYYTMIVFVPDINGKNAQGDNLVGGNTCAPIFKDIVSELAKGF